MGALGFCFLFYPPPLSVVIVLISLTGICPSATEITPDGKSNCIGWDDCGTVRWSQWVGQPDQWLGYAGVFTKKKRQIKITYMHVRVDPFSRHHANHIKSIYIFFFWPGKVSECLGIGCLVQWCIMGNLQSSGKLWKHHQKSGNWKHLQQKAERKNYILSFLDEGRS